MTSRILRLVRTALALLFLLTPAFDVRADDTADEAELQFQLGAERYRTGDYRGALEHFLQSNRLAPNKNVLFNIARAYEQLLRGPDAYRFYLSARDGETNPATLSRIDEALARVAPTVAVLRIETEPAGATIYIDRKDLGARGSSPRALGLPAGRYSVIAELPGYERAVSTPVDVRLGQSLPVRLTLKQIVGEVRVEGETAGAEVRVDSAESAPVGVVPTTLTLPLGRHTLVLSKDGFRSQDVQVDVVANQRVTIRPKFEAQTGVVVVNAELRDALISIDGKPSGFTPAVLNVPIGPHRLQISLSGYRTYEQPIQVSATTEVRVDAQLVILEEVTAASRTVEAVEDAPSSVTIITAQELRAMGYPTITEAIRGVRGIYLSDDRSYETVGVRGFSRPGDYGNRILVLLDGHPTNDDYIESSYVGYDARVDIEDIDRIEIVRGPGSVLYGSSAFFGVINLISRSRAAPTHAEAGVSAAHYGVKRARVMGQVNFSENAGVWTSAAAAHGAGRDFYFQEFSNDPLTQGNARGVDGFVAGTATGRVWWKDLSVQWFLTSRKKNLPTGEYETVFGNPGTRFSDTRGFVEGRFEPRITAQVQLLSRAYVNYYAFDDVLTFLPVDGGNVNETFRGTWGGVEQRVAWSPVSAFRLTGGGELQRHFRAEQRGANQQGPYILDGAGNVGRNDPFSVAAGYVNADVTPVRVVKVSAGARYDTYSNSDSALSPRVALILKPYDRGNLKLLAGRAFRAPSVYELFYRGAQQIRPDETGLKLRPESVYSGEVEFSHRFSTTLTGLIAAYSNYVTDLVVLRDVPNPRPGNGQPDVVNQYGNSDRPILTLGGEMELRREWRGGWMAAATYSNARSRYVGSGDTNRRVPNSPEHLASVKFAFPIVGRSLGGMSRVTFEGPRFDSHDTTPAPGTTDPQTTTEPFVVWDLVFSGEAERLGIRYAVGVYNVTDTRYTTIPSVEFRQRQLVQNGRTLLANVSVSF